MITNFEEITEELTDEELKLVPNIVKHLKTKIGKENAITSKQVVAAYKANGKKMSGPRWRKIIHHIRVKNLVPLLISTSKGYYISHDKDEIESYIKSLSERINSITEIKNAMEHQLNEYIN